jgi:hypothetical protein
MIHEYKTSDWFWAEMINTACHATNRLYLYKLLKKTSNELLTVTSQMSLISGLSKVSVMFFKRDQSLLNLLLKYMKVSC